MYCNSNILLGSFQRDFNMAISWWMATGINHKMAKDVDTLHSRGEAYWSRKFIHENIPLNVHHVLPALIVLILCLVFSTCIFFGEMLLNLYKKKGERNMPIR